MKRSVVHRYVLSGAARRCALDALDLAASPGTVVGTSAEANVFFARARRPTDGGRSSLPVRTRSDASEDINPRACIAAARSDGQLLSAPRCYCDYPQPPDADLITVDVDHAGADGVNRKTARGSKDGAPRPDSKISASLSSWWRRSKKFVTDFVVCLCCWQCEWDRIGHGIQLFLQNIFFNAHISKKISCQSIKYKIYLCYEQFLINDKFITIHIMYPINMYINY